MTYFTTETDSNILLMNALQDKVFYISINKSTKDWFFYLNTNDHSHYMYFDENGKISFKETIQEKKEMLEVASNLMFELLSFIKNDKKYNVFLLTNANVPPGVHKIWENI